MTESDLPAPDQAPGAPHPRETQRLFGQTAAEAELCAAFAGGRMHHAWLFTGPRGVGKATLAWHFARFLLATPPPVDDGLFGAPPPPTSLDVDPDHPVARRILAGSEPGLAAITRSANPTTGRMRDRIVVDDIRQLARFFGLSAADGGHRVVLVDAADEMNVSAANALLKMLEEPPARTTLLLVSHQPAQLLPTIRSRCRTLRLQPLAPHDMDAALRQAGADAPSNPAHLAELAAGSVGTALRLIMLDGLGLYAKLLDLLSTLPNLDRPRALALAETAAARGATDRLDLIFSLLDTALARLARTGATGAPPPEAADGESALLLRLSQDAHAARIWADAAASLRARVGHGRAVNLDPAALVLDTMLKIQQTALERS
ncbi:DNA polymerase III subunit delta' [Thalassococcus sp. S3]|uniref:DNA polymerase III subunit delta' n=1 Tax=Thalassococcus sp. S3 TaxID=2017482 RepID=UPI0010248086|nr:DNA polymerase III subunit delta' [Thalassococcus sp. S3]QBF32619.1 DNA polymerase III subunit delta' [Thalassococcus sp. S3]